LESVFILNGLPEAGIGFFDFYYTKICGRIIKGGEQIIERAIVASGLTGDRYFWQSIDWAIHGPTLAKEAERVVRDHRLKIMLPRGKWPYVSLE
jgi:hypothetical protein